MTNPTKPRHATPLMRAVRELRYIYRLSQRHFAKFIVMPRGRLATIETGWSEPSDAYLVPIARVAGVTVEELRAGIIAVDSCKNCKGRGVTVAPRRTVKRVRMSEHPGTPTIPKGE